MTKFYSIILLLTLTCLQSSFLCKAQTYNGSVSLINQAEVDSFGALGYSNITGNLSIGPDGVVQSDINSLTPLLSLRSIDSSLTIQNNTPLLNLNGLDSISHIGRDLDINGNYNLQNLIGLGDFDSLYYLNISFNLDLQNFNGLENLTYIEFAFNSMFCSSLTSYSGLNNLAYAGNIQLVNDHVQNIEAFGNLTVVDDEFRILGTSNIESLSGLENLSSVHLLSIHDHPNLTDYCALTNLVNNNGVVNFSVSNNEYNPTLLQLENGNCNPTIGLESNPANMFTLSPNPTTGDITINFGEFKQANLKVINQLGQIVYTKKQITESTFTFNLDAPEGIYTIEVFSKNRKNQFKVIKL